MSSHNLALQFSTRNSFAPGNGPGPFSFSSWLILTAIACARLAWVRQIAQTVFMHEERLVLGSGSRIEKQPKEEKDQQEQQ